MILLDTHAWLWLATEPRRLSKEASRAIRVEARRGGLGVAAISLWEASMLHARGRFVGPTDTRAFLRELLAGTRVEVCALAPEVAAVAPYFPKDFPRDPGDRLIAATARELGVPLVTADAKIRESRCVEVIW